MPVYKNKTTRVGVAVLFVAQVLFAPIQAAADPLAAERDQSRAMLYFSKGFGDARKVDSAPRFGLRFEQLRSASDLAFAAPGDLRSFKTTTDLRWTRGYGQSLRFAGMPILMTANEYIARFDSDDWSSLESSANNKGPAIVFGVVVGLAALCAAEELICEDDDDEDNYDGPPPDTGPDTGS